MEFGPEQSYYVDTHYRHFVLPVTPYMVFNEEDPAKRTAWWLFHEVGHLMVAPKSRRNRRDYGIPPGTVGDPYWDHDDNKASLIEFELCGACGLGQRQSTAKLIEEDYWSSRLKVWHEKEGKPLVRRLVYTASHVTVENLRDWEIVRVPKEKPVQI
jgi:hypothetical protein